MQVSKVMEELKRQLLVRGANYGMMKIDLLCPNPMRPNPAETEVES